MACALLARGEFYFMVKWLCAPRGPEAGLVFFFKLVLALVARGMFFSFGQAACAPRGPERRADFFFKWGFAPAARGGERGYARLSSLLRAKREPEKHPLLSRRGRHESRAARP